MKIAVVGGGGREHALVHKLLQSPQCEELYAIPGNGMIAEVASCVDIAATDVAAVTDWCAQNAIDYVVVAPDDPLALGMVDALAEKGIPAFGPSAAAARIEASKVFSKNLMQKYGIPTAAHQSFTDAEKALGYIRARGQYPVVVKADGLALGKGVLICEDAQQAEDAVRGMLCEGRFGTAGAAVVVEEFLQGPEVSVLCFCDGERLVPMASSMDHKRAYDGDEGPNTGGMGAIAPNPFYTKEMAARCHKEIFMPTLRAMAQEGAPFKGCLYFGLMLTVDGPRVIEYNCRFGDPETQVVLPLLEGDLLQVMMACTEGRLDAGMVQISSKAAACVVMASGGYPGSYQTGYPIAGIQTAQQAPGVKVYGAGVKAQDGGIVTAGGRVLCVCATAATPAAALDAAYTGVEKIQFKNAHYRKDIGRAGG